MLYSCDLDQFALGLFTLAQDRPSLDFTFFCELDSDHRKSGLLVGPTLDLMRDLLALVLADLRHRGRLRFMRYVRDPESQTTECDTDDIEEF